MVLSCEGWVWAELGMGSAEGMVVDAFSGIKLEEAVLDDAGGVSRDPMGIDLEDGSSYAWD